MALYTAYARVHFMSESKIHKMSECPNSSEYSTKKAGRS